MILDRIEHFQRYSKIIPEISDVIKFAKKTKKENLPAGKYPLRNGFVLIQEGITHHFDNADFEVHREYMDIHVMISGSEYVEYADKINLKTKVPFSLEKDLELMSGDGCKILIKPDTFYILYPTDGHKPCCHGDIPTNYKKVLAKIKIDRLIHKVC